MPRTSLLLASLAFAAALAGCSDDPAPEEPVAPSPPAAPAPVHLTTQEAFDWDASVGVPTTGLDAQLMARNAARFDVPNGTLALNVTAEWTCTTPLCGLHAYLYEPGVSAGLPGSPPTHAAHAMGPSPLVLAATVPVAGEWLVAVHSDAANAQVQGTFTFDAIVPGA